MPALKPDTIVPTDQEDAEITRQAIEDGTYYTDEELAQFKPASEFKEITSFLKTVSRPKSNTPKTPISIQLSAEVVEYFKASGKDWQSQIDKVLKDYLADN